MYLKVGLAYIFEYYRLFIASKKVVCLNLEFAQQGKCYSSRV